MFYIGGAWFASNGTPPSPDPKMDRTLNISSDRDGTWRLCSVRLAGFGRWDYSANSGSDITTLPKIRRG